MRSLFTKRRLAFLGIIIIMVMLAGVLQPRILSMREQELIDFAPPGELKHIVLFTQALGAFRSIAIDALWVRAMDLKNDGKFFELAQLYDLICQLEPHFAEIWIHNAWNMAYNISVELPTAEERWIWVQKGISLLRDKAIPYNPREGELYKELSWFYLHKIGDDLDNMHRYYKTQMVLTHHYLLGPGQDIESIAAAPNTLTKLFKDKDVETLYRKIEAEGMDPLDADLMMKNAFGVKAQEVLSDEENAGPSKKILDFLRKKYLLEKLKLDPEKMLELDEKYGKLDWRMPEVHGLYWIEQSIPLLKYDEEKDPLFYHRYIYTAFRLMFSRGKPRIITVKTTDEATGQEMTEVAVQLSPNVKWVDKLNEVFLYTIDLLEDETGKFSMENAHRNWLGRAVYTLYTYGEQEKAREYYGKYIRVKGGAALKKPFEKYIMEEAAQYLRAEQKPKLARANIEGFLLQALDNREFGDEDEAIRLENLAKMFYDAYVKENKGYEPRFWIGTFEEIYEAALGTYRDKMGTLNTKFHIDIEK